MTGLRSGQAYVFSWVGNKEITAKLITSQRKIDEGCRWLTMRIRGGQDFGITRDDILREAPPLPKPPVADGFYHFRNSRVYHRARAVVGVGPTTRVASQRTLCGLLIWSGWPDEHVKERGYRIYETDDLLPCYRCWPDGS